MVLWGRPLLTRRPTKKCIVTVVSAQRFGSEALELTYKDPVEADRQNQQLRGVLHRLGATPSTEITILSDGADGPRWQGEAASVGTTCYVLD